jgi:hypothetical protein
VREKIKGVESQLTEIKTRANTDKKVHLQEVVKLVNEKKKAKRREAELYATYILELILNKVAEHEQAAEFSFWRGIIIYYLILNY